MTQGIELELKEGIAPVLGMSYGGRIAILPGQAAAEEFSTLVHELAHLCCVRGYVVLNISTRDAPQGRAQNSYHQDGTRAEAKVVAFIVSQTLGLEPEERQRRLRESPQRRTSGRELESNPAYISLDSLGYRYTGRDSGNVVHERSAIDSNERLLPLC